MKIPTSQDVARARTRSVACPTCRAPIGVDCPRGGFGHVLRQRAGVRAMAADEAAVHGRAMLAVKRIRERGAAAGEHEMWKALACACSACLDDQESLGWLLVGAGLITIG